MKRFLWPLLDTFSKIEDLGSISQGGWVKKSKKKMFRGKPPVMSGEVYRCPIDSPELSGGLEKNSTKNRNFREASGGLGEVGGTSEVPSHLIPTHPTLKKNTFFHNSNFDKSIKIRTQRGNTDPDLFDFQG